MHLRGGPPAAPLAAILGETNVSAHHFCTDDDDDTPSGRDPTCSVYDLSDDPVAYFYDRLQLAQVQPPPGHRAAPAALPLPQCVAPYRLLRGAAARSQPAGAPHGALHRRGENVRLCSPGYAAAS